MVGRRGLLAAGGSALLLAGCGAKKKPSAAQERKDNAKRGDDEQEPIQADIDLLAEALAAEYKTVAAYSGAAAVARGAQLSLVNAILRHENAHADGVRQRLTAKGGRAAIPKLAPATFTDANAALSHAIAIELDSIALYTDILPKFSDGKLRAFGAAILTTEAEHLTLLRDALGQPSVPDPFVQGQSL